MKAHPVSQRSFLLAAPCMVFAWALALALSGTAAVQAGQLAYVQTADGSRSAKTRSLVQWTHTRLVFSADLDRVAVGRNEILEVEVLGKREVLALGKSVGRTSLIVWYPDGSTETFLFSVVQDLSMLRRALSDVHHAIRIELAPDRAALVLRGTVPTMDYKHAADRVAREYLDAGRTDAIHDAPTMIDSNAGAAINLVDRLSNNAAQLLRNPRAMTAGGASRGSTAAVINLLKVEQMPLSSEEKILQAVQAVGGEQVTVRRIVRGQMANDEMDTLLLEGHVRNQVALVRVLNIASRLLMGPAADGTMEVVADESGALMHDQGSRGQSSLSGVAGSIGASGGGLGNDIRNNIGRAKMISVAGGRILSTITVDDLPQVRVAVQIHEVDRKRMKNWRPDLSLISNDYQANSFSPNGTGMTVQPDPDQRIGAGLSGLVEGALQVLGGSLTSNLQIGGSEMAFDLLFSLMEQEGISRTLSRPSLTVLAGESAVFQVGGEVPVATSFATPGADNSANGVFSGTEFRPFGVQLSVRPMVGEDDRITLDVRPSVSLPDTGLTQLIAGSTGAPVSSTAFNTRSLETTTRLADGQPLVVAGLVSRSIGDRRQFTPGAHKLPLVGKLAESYGLSDDDRELVIVVTPTLVREARHDLGLWQFPGALELLGAAIPRTPSFTISDTENRQ